MPNQPAFDFAVDAASGRACTISAARRLIPSWQGQYDSFCSIYAIINGLRLVLAPIAPLSDEECERLFRFGVRLLAERDELVSCAQDGLELPSYQIVAHAMAEHVAQRSGAMVVVEQLFVSHSAGRRRGFAAACTLVALLASFRGRAIRNWFPAFAGTTKEAGMMSIRAHRARRSSSLAIDRAPGGRRAAGDGESRAVAVQDGGARSGRVPIVDSAFWRALTSDDFGFIHPPQVRVL
jgi:hypothetical protein